MDLQSLEEEAKTSALKHVSVMLQRPDQLEKLEAYKKRTERKKAAVEAMLKTAVQSQLEGVKTGLIQLQTATEDIRTVKENLTDIEELLKDIVPLKQKLSKLKEENKKHSQYAAAMENLKQIFNVPETIEKTHQMIQEGKLLHAHKNLMELETARDDLMFEVHRLQSQSEYDKNLLKTYFSEVDKLAQELAKQLWYVLGRTLEAVRGTDPGPQQVVSALRIIEREERIDDQCIDKHKTTGFMPVGRPRRWKEKCFQILEHVVKQRVEGTQLEDRSINKDWLARYLEICRQTVVQDLRGVKGGCLPCFPPEYNIYDRYVKMYHQCLSDRLKEIAEDNLDKNELFQLLTWLKTYASEDMLGHPTLMIDVHRLLIDHPLLSKTTINHLCEKFLELTQRDLSEWLDKTLQQEKDDWYKGASPEEDTLGFFYSALPSILFQMFEDQVAIGKEIGIEIIPRILLVNVEELLRFTGRYRAVANNCGICLESTDKLKKHIRLTVEAEISSPRGNVQRQELLQKIDQIKEKWNANCQIAIASLLEEVFQDLNVHLAEIMTKKWVTGGSAFETICATVEDYAADHKHLKPHILSSLLMDSQYKILGEYMKALENRRLTFSSAEDRKLAGERLEKEGERLKNLYSRLVPQDEEGVSSFELITDVLPEMAEVLALQDKSLLSLIASSFLRKFPDITVEQLSGLIQMREDTGRSEARQTAQELLDQNKYRPAQVTPYARLFRPKAEEVPRGVYQYMESVKNLAPSHMSGSDKSKATDEVPKGVGQGVYRYVENVKNLALTHTQTMESVKKMAPSTARATQEKSSNPFDEDD